MNLIISHFSLHTISSPKLSTAIFDYFLIDFRLSFPTSSHTHPASNLTIYHCRFASIIIEYFLIYIHCHSIAWTSWPVIRYLSPYNLPRALTIFQQLATRSFKCRWRKVLSQGLGTTAFSLAYQTSMHTNSAILFFPCEECTST